jgi:dTDP-4-amino-4,6-dideoxygalactose transaminase
MHLVPTARATRTRFAAWPHFDESDIRIVEEVLRSGKVNYWTGDEGRQFEREYAAYTGTKHAIALANGTVALELALRALGVAPGDEVVTTSRAFIACASCVVAVGATPVFADVDRESQNITAATIRARITRRTRAIIAVHLAGMPCDMDAILTVAKEHGITVIEDCAQAHGARYKGRPVGSIGDIGTFSFCQDKIISTGGEGGMITLNDDAHWNYAWSFKDHGKSFNAVCRHPHTEGIRWVHESPGTNWRLTEMQSALGRNALRRLDGWVKTRRRNAEILRSSLVGLQTLRVPEVPSECYHSYYKFYAFLELGALKPGWTRDRIAHEISAAGVPCSAGGCGEIYLEKAFAEGSERRARMSVAQELAETSLMFLVHPTLSAEDMDFMGRIAACTLRLSGR